MNAKHNNQFSIFNGVTEMKFGRLLREFLLIILFLID